MTVVREKHSSTQIKRLFKQHPARQRVHARLGMIKEPNPPPTPTFAPVLENVEMLSNGWVPPPPADLAIPNYPFKIVRTKNKPQDAVGFLPVYSKFRLVQSLFFRLVVDFSNNVSQLLVSFDNYVINRKDGTLTTTRIKKVSGDQQVFLRELRAALQIPEPTNYKDDVIRVRAGGTIEVKGNHVRQVRMWLAGLGF